MGFTPPTVGAALLLAVAAIALAGCGEGGGTGRATPGSNASAGTQAVTISDYVYEPGRIVVPSGTTVTFTNRDAAPHTATSKRPEAFDTGTVRKGETGDITLDASGTFAYYCLFHPFMKGTIVVR